MTTITGNFKDSLGQPMVGYLSVLADYVITDNLDNTSYLPIAGKVSLSPTGSCSVTLEPSEVARVTYLFELYQQVPAVGLEPASDLLVWSFRSQVPDSLTPINFSDLMITTGITHDALDSSLTAVVRKLYNDPSFWVRLQQEVLIHTGTYSVDRRYRLGEVVNFQGSSYVFSSQEAATGVSPTDAGYWRLLASIGNTGGGTMGNPSAYDATGWLNQADAASRGALRNIIETLATKVALDLKAPLSNPLLVTPRASTAPLLTDRSSLLVSSEWVQQQTDALKKAVVPVGSTMGWTTTSPPAGWLLCNGQVVSRTTYANLFTVIGTLFNTGSESATQFRVPTETGNRIIYTGI